MPSAAPPVKRFVAPRNSIVPSLRTCAETGLPLRNSPDTARKRMVAPVLLVNCPDASLTKCCAASGNTLNGNETRANAVVREQQKRRLGSNRDEIYQEMWQTGAFGDITTGNKMRTTVFPTMLRNSQNFCNRKMYTTKKIMTLRTDSNTEKHEVYSLQPENF